MALVSLRPYPRASLKEHPVQARLALCEKVQLGSLGTEGVQEGPRCLGPRAVWSIDWLVTGRAGRFPGVRPCGLSGSLQIDQQCIPQMVVKTHCR